MRILKLSLILLLLMMACDQPEEEVRTHGFTVEDWRETLERHQQYQREYLQTWSSECEDFKLTLGQLEEPFDTDSLVILELIREFEPHSQHLAAFDPDEYRESLLKTFLNDDQEGFFKYKDDILEGCSNTTESLQDNINSISEDIDDTYSPDYTVPS